MEKRAFDVEIALPPPHEKQGRCAIYQDADGGDDHHRFRRDNGSGEANRCKASSAMAPTAIKRMMALASAASKSRRSEGREQV